jgi:hypothetical protein
MFGAIESARRATLIAAFSGNQAKGRLGYGDNSQQQEWHGSAPLNDILAVDGRFSGQRHSRFFVRGPHAFIPCRRMQLVLHALG